MGLFLFRDKMEARAKKGLWNGGLVPLGFDYSPEEKKLKVNPEEAKIVKLIFETYLKEKSLAKVVKKINSLGYRSKSHPTSPSVVESLSSQVSAIS